MGKTVKTTPAGIAVWPKLDTPDTKFKAEGVYSIKVMFNDSSEEAVAALKQACDEAAEEQLEITRKALAEKVSGAKNNIEKKKAQTTLDELKMFVPYVEDEDSGNIQFTFSMNASGVSKKTSKPWQRKPAVFDAKGVPTKDIRVGSGSKVKVAYEPFQFYNAAQNSAGVSLRLEAVQVINLVEFGNRDASGFGFGEEDGDFSFKDRESENDSPFGESPTGETPSGDDNNGDF